MSTKVSPAKMLNTTDPRKNDMKPRIFITISLVAVVLFVGCTPTAAPEPAQPEAPAQPAPTKNEPTAPPPTTPTVSQLEAPPTEALPTEAPTEVPQVVATSRGPNLEASDPAAYTRASGGLQLVEFFAFW